MSASKRQAQRKQLAFDKADELLAAFARGELDRESCAQRILNYGAIEFRACVDEIVERLRDI